jgi:hypothetical protein
LDALLAMQLAEVVPKALAECGYEIKRRKGARDGRSTSSLPAALARRHTTYGCEALLGRPQEATGEADLPAAARHRTERAHRR